MRLFRVGRVPYVSLGYYSHHIALSCSCESMGVNRCVDVENARDFKSASDVKCVRHVQRPWAIEYSWAARMRERSRLHERCRITPRLPKCAETADLRGGRLNCPEDDGKWVQKGRTAKIRLSHFKSGEHQAHNKRTSELSFRVFLPTTCLNTNKLTLMKYRYRYFFYK